VAGRDQFISLHCILHKIIYVFVFYIILYSLVPSVKQKIAGTGKCGENRKRQDLFPSPAFSCSSTDYLLLLLFVLFLQFFWLLSELLLFVLFCEF